MRTYKKTIELMKVVERECVVLDKQTCDICGTLNLNNNGQWTDSDIQINHLIEDSYSDGGESKLYEYDLCAKCFQDKLIPLLDKEFGISPQITEKEW